MARKMLQFKIVGSKRVSAKMLQVAEDLRGQTLLTAVQVGALAVEGDAKLSVPVDTGAVRRSIRRVVVKNEPNIAIVKVTTGGKDVHGGRPVALFVEYGTSRSPAQPFLRPALRKNRALIRRAVAGTVGSILRTRFGR